MNQAIAAKAFILNEKNELLLIRGADDDVHKPGVWEVPGGRIESDEDILNGLKRETKEETGLDISIQSPLKEHNFTREDGQKIRMLTYLCRLAGKASVRLSKEHTDHVWLKTEEAKSRIAEDFHGGVEVFERHLIQNKDS